MKVTCPVTGRTERVSVEPTPCGTLITGCSRFIPVNQIGCGGTCAAAIDHALLSDRQHRAERVLIVYGNAHHTESIARQLAALLSKDGLLVELADADKGRLPPPEDYDAVLLGLSFRFWRPPRAVTSYIKSHRAGLAELPNFLFLVGGVAAKDLAQLAERTGWMPHGVATFARPDEAGMPDVADLRTFAYAVGDAIPASELEH